jgi:DNA-binding transcriptional ArsR family regulator
MDAVFKALADPHRRKLLDRLYEHDGRTLGELCEGLSISRQAVSKHLAILEHAGMLVTHRAGREKLHYLNPLPIQEISDRWIGRYARRHVAAVAALKQALEETNDA